jgi:hypothetical protein
MNADMSQVKSRAASTKPANGTTPTRAKPRGARAGRLRFRTYLREAKIWAHFAIRLGKERFGMERPFDPNEKKEVAIEQSMQLGSNGLTFVLRPRVENSHHEGLRYLYETVQAIGAKYVQIGAENRYDEETGSERVFLFIEQVRRREVRKLRIGELPAEDAFWIAPLLQRSIHPRLYLLNLRQAEGVEGPYALSVAVGHVYDLAKDYIDLMDDLSATRSHPEEPEMLPLYHAPSVSLR